MRKDTRRKSGLWINRLVPATDAIVISERGDRSCEGKRGGSTPNPSIHMDLPAERLAAWAAIQLDERGRREKDRSSKNIREKVCCV